MLHNQLDTWDQRELWESSMEWGATDGLFDNETEANYAMPMIRDVR